MRDHIILPVFAVALIFGTTLNLTRADDFPILTGPYLGQEPPGLEPRCLLGKCEGY